MRSKTGSEARALPGRRTRLPTTSDEPDGERAIDPGEPDGPSGRVEHRRVVGPEARPTAPRTRSEAAEEMAAASAVRHRRERRCPSGKMRRKSGSADGEQGDRAEDADPGRGRGPGSEPRDPARPTEADLRVGECRTSTGRATSATVAEQPTDRVLGIAARDEGPPTMAYDRHREPEQDEKDRPTAGRGQRPSRSGRSIQIAGPWRTTYRGPAGGRFDAFHAAHRDSRARGFQEGSPVPPPGSNLTPEGVLPHPTSCGGGRLEASTAAALP